MPARRLLAGLAGLACLAAVQVAQGASAVHKCVANGSVTFQSTPCAETRYFLAHCPDTHMDGNRDGVPCEQQWCTHPFVR